MRNKKLKVRCNKCGNYEYCLDNQTKLVCSNCNNTINLNDSFVSGVRSNERIQYELENTVLEDDEYRNLLKEALDNNINNELIEYLKQKETKTFDASLLNDDNNYKNIIIKDILRSNSYKNEERIKMIQNSNLSNKDILISIIDESSFKTEESKELKAKLYTQNIEIVHNKFEKAGDLTMLNLLIGFGLVLLIFLFGLFFDNDLARPIVIILSIIPAIIFGITIASKLSNKLFLKILYSLLLILILYYVISYIEVLRIDGFVSLIDHFNHIINAIPNFIDEILERMTITSDFDVPTEGGE